MTQLSRASSFGQYPLVESFYHDLIACSEVLFFHIFFGSFFKIEV